MAFGCIGCWLYANNCSFISSTNWIMAFPSDLLFSSYFGDTYNRFNSNVVRNCRNILHVFGMESKTNLEAVWMAFSDPRIKINLPKAYESINVKHKSWNHKNQTELVSAMEDWRRIFSVPFCYASFSHNIFQVLKCHTIHDHNAIRSFRLWSILKSNFVSFE